MNLLMRANIIIVQPKATSIPPPITTSGSTSPAKAKNVLRSSTKGHRLSTASAKLPTAPSPKKIPPSTAGATENGSSGGTTEGKRRSDSNSSSSSMQSSNEEKKRKKKSGESPRGEKNSPKRTAAMSNESQSLYVTAGNACLLLCPHLSLLLSSKVFTTGFRGEGSDNGASKKGHPEEGIEHVKFVLCVCAAVSSQGLLSAPNMFHCCFHRTKLARNPGGNLTL